MISCVLDYYEAKIPPECFPGLTCSSYFVDFPEQKKFDSEIFHDFLLENGLRDPPTWAIEDYFTIEPSLSKSAVGDALFSADPPADPPKDPDMGYYFQNSAHLLQVLKFFLAGNLMLPVCSSGAYSPDFNNYVYGDSTIQACLAFRDKYGPSYQYNFTLQEASSVQDKHVRRLFPYHRKYLDDYYSALETHYKNSSSFSNMPTSEDIIKKKRSTFDLFGKGLDHGGKVYGTDYHDGPVAEMEGYILRHELYLIAQLDSENPTVSGALTIRRNIHQKSLKRKIKRVKKMVERKIKRRKMKELEFSDWSSEEEDGLGWMERNMLLALKRSSSEESECISGSAGSGTNPQEHSNNAATIIHSESQDSTGDIASTNVQYESNSNVNSSAFEESNIDSESISCGSDTGTHTDTDTDTISSHTDDYFELYDELRRHNLVESLPDISDSLDGFGQWGPNITSDDELFSDDMAPNMDSDSDEVLPPRPTHQSVFLRTGDFGPLYYDSRNQVSPVNKHPNISQLLLNRKLGVGANRNSRPDPVALGSKMIPAGDCSTIAVRDHGVVAGTFTEDGSKYISADMGFALSFYDTTDPSHPVYKGVIDATPIGTWSITDVAASRSGNMMAACSLTSRVLLGDTESLSIIKIIDFREGHNNHRTFGVDFSPDSSKLVAGTSRGRIHVFDLERDIPVTYDLRHLGDVNSVKYADNSGNMLVSGSDDAYVRLWDLRSPLPLVRVMCGHTQSITCVAPKGDGNYFISNSEDNSLKLWDQRVCNSSVPRTNSHFSYATYFDSLDVNRYHDESMQTYTSHQVEGTLIRCNFSPRETTGQQYIYSGSWTGAVCIWHIDGYLVSKMRRGDRVPESHDNSLTMSDQASGSVMNNTQLAKYIQRKGPLGLLYSVRDVAWHPRAPTIYASLSYSKPSSNAFESHGELMQIPFRTDYGIPGNDYIGGYGKYESSLLSSSSPHRPYRPYPPFFVRYER